MKNQMILVATLALLAASTRFVHAQAKPGPIVVPSKIEANEPFTFGISGVVEGEVVEVKMVEGEVVARHKPDRLGRVFLPAGLAAGTYLLSTSGGPRTPRLPVNCTVAPGLGGTSIDLLKIDSPLSGVNFAEGFKLKGSGFSPNAADMVAEIGCNNIPVLAATSDEILTGPIGVEMPTEKEGLHLRNQKTGQGSYVPDLVCYSLTSQLAKRTLTGGEQTVLEFKLAPEHASVQVLAKVLSGPVTFAGGASEIAIEVAKGRGSAPLYSHAGNPGKFNVGWNAAGDVMFNEDGPGGAERARKAREKYEKHQKAAEAAQAEAEKAEKAAKDAEDKGNDKKAAEERKKAADKRKEAAAHHRANREYNKSAEQERAAAEDSRKQAEKHDKEGKSQKPGKDARRDGAEAEERAAADEQRDAAREERYDKKRAADDNDRAADGYDRAAKGYRANGEGSKASDAEKAAEGARKEAERLRK